MRRGALPLALLAGLAAAALPQDPAPPTAAARLASARDWLYQLQELDPDAVAATRSDVLVSDPTRDGSSTRAPS